MGYRLEIDCDSGHWQLVKESLEEAVIGAERQTQEADNPDDQYRVVYRSDAEQWQLEIPELRRGGGFLMFRQEPELWELWRRLIARGYLEIDDRADAMTDSSVCCRLTDAGRAALKALEQEGVQGFTPAPGWGAS